MKIKIIDTSLWSHVNTCSECKKKHTKHGLSNNLPWIHADTACHARLRVNLRSHNTGDCKYDTSQHLAVDFLFKFCFFFDCLKQLDIVTPYQLYFNPELIFKNFQVLLVKQNLLKKFLNKFMI